MESARCITSILEPHGSLYDYDSSEERLANSIRFSTYAANQDYSVYLVNARQSLPVDALEYTEDQFGVFSPIFTRRRYFRARMMPPQKREQYFAQGFCGVNRFLQLGFSQVIYAPVYKSRLTSRP